MAKAKNILFIMYDQLRFDYLSCAGHPHLHTPHIDRLAEKGVRFNNCYVQSPVCGASRMSYYTGRYVHSHGASWNNFPLKVGELTLGDHLRKLGMSCSLVGKTHMKVDSDGMERLGLASDSVIGARVAECGFDVFTREDGLFTEGPNGYYHQPPSAYNDYLHAKGYTADNAWHHHANSGITDAGDVASGFLMSNASMQANIREEDSETPWLTSQAIEFIDQKKGSDEPWLCHLSYIKPHWPYIVPAPYHDMYNSSHVLPVNRHDSERDNTHPVYSAFMNNVIGQAFHRKEVRDKVIPAYMGLIKQCDDQLGRLFEYLEANDEMQDTMIVVSSDHGDYLGDHWLGEKDLFHQASVKVPLIVYDPSEASDSTRGSECDALVEGIDLCATFIEYAGGEVPTHIVEGRSILPFLHGDTPTSWRDYVISEYDYSQTPMCMKLGVEPKDARLFMLADHRYTFVHAEGGFRPMLFDRETDPNEFNDLGGGNSHAEILDGFYEKLADWARRCSQRTTRSDEQIIQNRGASRTRGILLGAYDKNDLDENLLCRYTGKVDRYI
ncbi:MAG: sulfatase-like hydrolase/transferase [Gammaproteobacteria bacterium]|nr:sulfatase-like hydrolase/transferase [Gammaproteobacteria bacterium]